MLAVRNASSSATLDVYRWVRLTCPSTRHARRWETVNTWQT